jgi:TolB-like protein/thioredoxin-like negative regulator of GroEL
MGHFLNAVIERRIPQILGIYLAAGWGLIEFTDWAAEEFAIAAPLVIFVFVGLGVLLGPVLVVAWRLAGARDGRPTARPIEPAPRSVAVLPFTAVGDDPEAELFGFGLADQIVTDLARIADLQVVSRSSSFAYKDAPTDVRDVGRRLAARAVLEGCVQRSGTRIRVTTQLIDARTGYHLWSERFDRTTDDLFAIEDEIAASVAQVLDAVLGENERKAITKIPTQNARALEYYVRGRRFLFQTRRRSLVFAREMFQRAIAADPGFALAHAGLADVGALLAMYFPMAQPDLAGARESAEKALALDPDQAEVHAAHGAVLFVSGDLEGAERAFQRAVALDPRLFEAYYFHARACFQSGRFDEAVDLYRKATQVREDYASAFFLAQSEEALGRTDAALEAYGEALDVAERHLDLNPDDPRAATMRAVALCRLGRRTEGLEWAERALRLDPEDAGVRYNAACLYAVAGKADRAMECLTAAADIGFGNPDWLARDPDLTNLRELPEFQTLMARMESRS